ncbi:MAG: hypothetical protein NVS2B16_03210 [Chloroflexota bacterium]
MSRQLTWARAAAMGAATGSRSMMPIATEAWAAATGRLPLEEGPLRQLSNLDLAGFLVLAAAGEVLVDKSGLAPSRTSPGPFGGRVFFGALAGAVIAAADKRPTLFGALLGAVAAGISTHITARVRQALDQSGLPDPLVAAAEDVLVLAVCRAAAMRHGATPWWRGNPGSR